MTSGPVAVLLLAAAVVMSPDPVRRRLPGLAVAPADRRRLLAMVAAPTAAVAAATAPPALIAVGGIAAMVLETWRRRRRSRMRRRAQARAMAAALEVLIGELRVGAHPARAFAVAAVECPGAVGDSLQRVAVRTRLGADVAAGLLAAGRDSAIPAHWRRLAVFWELAAQRGLALSVLMQAAYQDILERQRFADHLQAALAGARATAAILAALPALGVLLGELIGAHPVRFLLGGGLGGVLLVLGVGLIAVGLGWADRIIERLQS